MKKRSLRLWAVALVLGCVAALLVPAVAAARKSTYLTVVNDTVLEMRDETMPFLSGGELYVPYTVFDPNATGIQLGVFCSYGNNVVVLYGRQIGALIFDLAQDTATSSTGKEYTKRAVRHNSIIFVPVDIVTKYFGLSWSIQVDKDYGCVVRIMSASAQIPNADFLSQGHYIIESRYNAYLRSKGLLAASPFPIPTYEPLPEPEPEPLPSPSAAPSPPPEPSKPEPAESETPRPQGGDVYVAVRCGHGGDTAALAAALDRQQARGVFFFPAEELAGRDGEVRTLAAAGHKIGLLLDGEDGQERQAQWERGCELLGHILRTGADIVLTPEGEKVPAGALGWTATADGTQGERTAARQMEETLEAAVRPEDTFLLLDDGLQTAGLVQRLLEQMAEEGCEFRLSLETALAG